MILKATDVLELGKAQAYLVEEQLKKYIDAQDTGLEYVTKALNVFNELEGYWIENDL